MNSSFLKRHSKRELELYFCFFQNKFPVAVNDTLPSIQATKSRNQGPTPDTDRLVCFVCYSAWPAHFPYPPLYSALFWLSVSIVTLHSCSTAHKSLKVWKALPWLMLSSTPTSSRVTQKSLFCGVVDHVRKLGKVELVRVTGTQRG